MADAYASFADSLIITSGLLTERTGGRFKLQLYGSGEIFKGAEIFNAVRSGVLVRLSCIDATA